MYYYLCEDALIFRIKVHGQGPACWFGLHFKCIIIFQKTRFHSWHKVNSITQIARDRRVTVMVFRVFELNLSYQYLFGTKLVIRLPVLGSIQVLIITDSVLLWKIQKFDWLIPETKWHSCLHNRALCSYLATLRLLRQRENNPQFSGTY